jgi:uncharacterized membrane protein YpjA
MRFVAKLSKLLKTPKFLFLLIIVNLIGSLYGFYWYKDQLAKSPVFLWPFIPDSPTASALFTIVLCFYLVKSPKTLLTLIACGWLVKYGIWAAVINTHFLLTGGDYTFANFHLTVSHLGMAAEGILFAANIRISKAHGILLLVLMVLSDVVDSLRSIGLKCFEPKGAFYAFPSIKGTGLTSEKFCERLLKEGKVAVVPGSAFGQSGRDFVRLSYATSMENLKTAMDRISGFVKRI